MKPELWDDEEAPPSEEELAAAAKLRDALEAPTSKRQPDLALAEELRALHSPKEIDAATHERIIEGALVHLAKKRRSNVIRVSFGVVAFAAAAGFAFFFGAPTGGENVPAYARARSAQELFAEPFPAAGGTSARVDRIADARSRDLRANRFASWGVK